MSSDAFADLGRCLSQFAEGLRGLVDANQRSAAGSPADKEADGEPYAGDWGLHPSGAVFTTVLLTTWSCTDHLSAAGTVLERHQGISSLYTLTRGAAESAAIACCLTEPGIGSLERVPLENRIRLVTCKSSGCQAAREYSLIRPPRTGFRWIRPRSRSATVGWPSSCLRPGTRWAMPWCGRAVL